VITALPVTYPAGRETMSFLFVRVETNDGIVGYGEACDSYGCSYASVVATVIEDVLAPLLIGQPLAAVQPLTDRMRLFTRRRLGDGWVAAHARSAIEIALWDVAGKATRRSVSSMLGQVRDRVEIYASCAFLEEGSADHHLELLAPLLARGVGKAKLRIGPEWREDMLKLAEIRAELDPRVELMIDGSEIFTLPTAQRIAGELAKLGVAWFEEPLPQGNRAGIEALARTAAVPIAYGEHLFGVDDAIDAMRRRQLQVLQPDASTGGGIAEARKMADAAAPFGVRVVPHVCAGPLSLAANLHVAGTVPAIRLIEYPPSLTAVWAGFGEGFSFGLDMIDNGMLPVPSGPGVGVGLNLDAVAAHPYQPPGARVAGTVGGLPDRFVGDR
jgi:D-galactarolactone cycloisomerase